MTYEELVQEVLKEYGAGFVWNVDAGRKIEKPVIQYEETDWEFLVRLYSHFYRPISGDMRMGNMAIIFGTHQGEERSMNGAEIREQGFDGFYYTGGGYEGGQLRSRTFYLEVECRESWRLGDWLFYEGRTYQIYKKKAAWKRGEIIFTYDLGAEGTFYRKKKYNEALAGIRLEGIVKETEGECVYLQLDIDEEKRADYPWVWTPETNNISYCMPEKETKAVLYLSSPKEEEGMVVLAAVRNQQSGRYGNTQQREFAIMYGKKLGLHPERLFMEGKEKKVSFSMEDRTGIQIQSSNGISLVADGEVSWEEKNIQVTAPGEVVCRTGKSNIELCRDINLYAPNGVQTLGTGSGTKRKYLPDKELDGQETEHWQTSFSAIAAIPAIDFGSVKGEEDMVDWYTCGGIPKLADSSSVFAMMEVMDGKNGGYFVPGVFYVNG